MHKIQTTTAAGRSLSHATQILSATLKNSCIYHDLRFCVIYKSEIKEIKAKYSLGWRFQGNEFHAFHLLHMQIIRLIFVLLANVHVAKYYLHVVGHPVRFVHSSGTRSLTTDGFEEGGWHRRRVTHVWLR